MTCRFCGKPDDSLGSSHLEYHKVEYLRDIASHLSTIANALENIQYEAEEFRKKDVSNVIGALRGER